MIYEFIKQAVENKKKLVAALIDPDTDTGIPLEERVECINNSRVDLIFVGGSTLYNRDFDDFVKKIKGLTENPVIIFPGSSLQISKHADAILFLSLISGRNPQYLIGEHVRAAPRLKKMDVEVIPTGYMLIESGSTTTVEFISNTRPIPRNKNEIALAHALAGEFLGMKLIYMDAGSGADNSIPAEMIRAVKSGITVPLIIGGGIRSKEDIEEKFSAGADIVVIGSLLEKEPEALKR